MNPENPKASKLASIAAIAAVAITLYWSFTYTGPYRYLAELQSKWFGWYAPKLTGLVIMLGFFAILGLARFLLKGAERPVPGLPAATNATARPPARVPIPLQRFKLYIAPVVLLGMGAWFSFTGMQAANLQQFQASDFEDAQVHGVAVYADVRGHLSDSYIAQDHYLYLPMRSDANVGQNAPIQLLVGIDENRTKELLHPEADKSYTVRGLADKGLAGDVKYAFEKNGMKVADTVWVIHAGRTPRSDLTAGLVLVGIGIILAGVLYWKEFRGRSSAVSRPLQTPARQPARTL